MRVLAPPTQNVIKVCAVSQSSATCIWEVGFGVVCYFCNPMSARVLCEVCGKEYAASAIYDHKTKEHGGEGGGRNTFACPKCAETFTSKQGRDYHVVSKHVPKAEWPHPCPNPGCIFRAASSGNLRKHLSKCTGAKVPMSEAKCQARRQEALCKEAERRKKQRHALKAQDPEAYETMRQREREQERARATGAEYKLRKARWRLANVAKCREYWRRYMSKPKVKDRKAAYWRSEHYKKLKSEYIKAHPRSASGRIVSQIIRKHRNMSLSVEEAEAWRGKQPVLKRLLADQCYYCGLEQASGADRLDNGVGYTDENIVPSCAVCNMMKGPFSADEFWSRCQEIVEYQMHCSEENVQLAPAEDVTAAMPVRDVPLRLKLLARAKHRGFPMTLTADDLDLCDDPDTRCWYCGVSRRVEVLGLDRLDSQRGYEPDNCVPCCGSCNFMKSDLAPDTFVDRVFAVHQQLQSVQSNPDLQGTVGQRLAQRWKETSSRVALDPALALPRPKDGPTQTVVADGDPRAASIPEHVLCLSLGEVYHNSEGCSKVQGRLFVRMHWAAAKQKHMRPCRECRLWIRAVETQAVFHNPTVIRAKRGYRYRAEVTESEAEQRTRLALESMLHPSPNEAQVEGEACKNRVCP